MRGGGHLSFAQAVRTLCCATTVLLLPSAEPPPPPPPVPLPLTTRFSAVSRTAGPGHSAGPAASCFSDRPGADPGGGGGAGSGAHPWNGGTRFKSSQVVGFLHLKGKKKRHWCPLNGCSTPLKHKMAINILKSCKSVFAYVKKKNTHPIPYKVINPLAPSPGRNPVSAPAVCPV